MYRHRGERYAGRNEKVSGASGEITFTKEGDPKKSVVISTIINGETAPICTIDPFEEGKGKKQFKKDIQEDKNGTEN